MEKIRHFVDQNHFLQPWIMNHEYVHCFFEGSFYIFSPPAFRRGVPQCSGWQRLWKPHRVDRGRH